MIIAFDVDGTLFDEYANPNYEVIDILRWFLRNGDRVIIWSGGGQDYARMQADKLGFTFEETGIEAYSKGLDQADIRKPDICFDDEFVQLGVVNIKINRKVKK